MRNMIFLTTRFFKLEESGRRGHKHKLFKKNFELILENFVLVVELWTNGIRYLHDVLIAAI